MSHPDRKSSVLPSRHSKMQKPLQNVRNENRDGSPLIATHIASTRSFVKEYPERPHYVYGYRQTDVQEKGEDYLLLLDLSIVLFYE